MNQGDFDGSPVNGDSEAFMPYQDIAQNKEDELPINRNDESEVPKRLLES